MNVHSTHTVWGHWEIRSRPVNSRIRVCRGPICSTAHVTQQLSAPGHLRTSKELYKTAVAPPALPGLSHVRHYIRYSGGGYIYNMRRSTQMFKGHQMPSNTMGGGGSIYSDQWRRHNV
jgi:hypothetical protein